MLLLEDWATIFGRMGAKATMTSHTGVILHNALAGRGRRGKEGGKNLPLLAIMYLL